MDKKRSTLGMGLSSLLGPEVKENSESNSPDIFQINVDQVTPCPFQPRKYFAESELNELADSIRKNGVLQPIIVRQIDPQAYEIIAGERRWRACKKAGLRFIPVIVKEASDKEVLHYAIIENIQRENLTPIEEALSYEQLRSEYNYTHDELANVLGKSRSYVSNILRLNSLDSSVKSAVQSGEISAGHARALLGVAPSLQIHLIEDIVKNTLSVRDLERKIRKLKSNTQISSGEQKKTPPPTKDNMLYDDADTKAIENHLSEVLNSSVTINLEGNPTLTIECNSFEILDLCVEKLSVIES